MMGTYIKDVGYINSGSKIFSRDPKGFRVWDGKVWNVKPFPTKGEIVGLCDGSVTVNAGESATISSYGSHKIGITWKEGNSTLSGYVFSNHVFTLDGYSGQAKEVDVLTGTGAVYDTVTIEFLGNNKANLSGRIADAGIARDAFTFLTQDNDISTLAFKARNAIHWTDMAVIFRITRDKMDVEGNFNVDGVKFSKQYLTTFLQKFIGPVIPFDYDWNTHVQREIDQTSGVTNDINNPANPNSPYYSADGVFAYDKDYGVIVYKNGVIVWTATGESFQEKSDGSVTGYDSQNKIVTYSSGTVLNLLTNERTTVDKQISKIRETDPWYKRLFNDTKMWYWIIAGLGFLLLIKRQRNA